jgi:hypothetical protein
MMIQKLIKKDCRFFLVFSIVFTTIFLFEAVFVTAPPPKEGDTVMYGVNRLTYHAPFWTYDYDHTVASNSEQITEYATLASTPGTHSSALREACAECEAYTTPAQSDQPPTQIAVSPATPTGVPAGYSQEPDPFPNDNKEVYSDGRGHFVTVDKTANTIVASDARGVPLDGAQPRPLQSQPAGQPGQGQQGQANAPKPAPEPVVVEGPNSGSGSVYYETASGTYEVLYAADGTTPVAVYQRQSDGTYKEMVGDPRSLADAVKRSSSDLNKERQEEEAGKDRQDAGRQAAKDAKDNNARSQTQDENDGPPYTSMQWPTGREFVANVRSQGGWFGAFFRSGPQQQFWRSVGRWSGIDEPVWDAGVIFFQQWSPINWANAWICERELGEDSGQQFAMSNTGMSWVSAEGVRTVVDPCPFGLESKTSSANMSCKPFFVYRLSGEAMPAETRIYFNVKLQPGDVDLYDGQMVKLEQGSAKWSLSGTRMHVFNSSKTYTQVCIDFDDDTFDELRTVFIALDSDQDPLCNDIQDISAAMAESKQVFTTTSTGAIVPPTTSGGSGGEGSSESSIPGSPSKNL